MAQHYDVAARKSFADRAFRGDEDFDVDVASKFLDSEILKCAEDQYDLLSAKRVANRAPLSRAALRAAPRTPEVVVNFCCCWMALCGFVFACKAPRNAPAVQGTAPVKLCTYCGKDTHFVDDCWAKNGKPSKQKQREQKQGASWSKKPRHS